MNLPHLEPLIFVKEILQRDGNKAIVKCQFKELPTLAIFIEAAAQCSVAFVDGDIDGVGFVTNVKSIEKIKELVHIEYDIHLQSIVTVNNISKFSFKAINSDDVYVSGEFTTYLQ
jgi:hypothetical protein